MTTPVQGASRESGERTPLINPNIGALLDTAIAAQWTLREAAKQYDRIPEHITTRVSRIIIELGDVTAELHALLKKQPPMAP